MPSVHPYFIPVFEDDNEEQEAKGKMYDSWMNVHFDDVHEYVGSLGLNIEESNELKIILLKENGKLCD